MEDHLRNKGRLQREWDVLCRYEAEPGAKDAALQEECTALNRPEAPLPYDHSRVILNHLANAEGLDYINASTIVSKLNAFMGCIQKKIAIKLLNLVLVDRPWSTCSGLCCRSRPTTRHHPALLANGLGTRCRCYRRTMPPTRKQWKRLCTLLAGRRIRSLSHLWGAFGQRAYLVWWLLGTIVLLEEFALWRNTHRHSIPLLVMASNW